MVYRRLNDVGHSDPPMMWKGLKILLIYFTLLPLAVIQGQLKVCKHQYLRQKDNIWVSYCQHPANPFRTVAGRQAGRLDDLVTDVR